jgi:hypothetical protein
MTPNRRDRKRNFRSMIHGRTPFWLPWSHQNIPLINITNLVRCLGLKERLKGSTRTEIKVRRWIPPPGCLCTEVNVFTEAGSLKMIYFWCLFPNSFFLVLEFALVFKTKTTCPDRSLSNPLTSSRAGFRDQRPDWRRGLQTLAHDLRQQVLRFRGKRRLRP